MRHLIVLAIVVLAPNFLWADDPKADGRWEGQPVRFTLKDIPDGIKALTGLLESCHDLSQFNAVELTKAERGDHIRLRLPKPITASVLGNKVEFNELVLRLPLNTGVLWVRSGDTWQRFAKYEFQKEEPIVKWLRLAQPVK